MSFQKECVIACMQSDISSKNLRICNLYYLTSKCFQLWENAAEEGSVKAILHQALNMSVS